MEQTLDSTRSTIYNVYGKGGAVMQVAIAKWGNSLGIRLPSSVIRDLGVKCGDKITIESTARGATLRKVRDPRAEMEEYFGKPISEITEDDLYGVDADIVDWGPDIGNEVIE